MSDSFSSSFVVPIFNFTVIDLLMPIERQGHVVVGMLRGLYRSMMLSKGASTSNDLLTRGAGPTKCKQRVSQHRERERERESIRTHNCCVLLVVHEKLLECSNSNTISYVPLFFLSFRFFFFFIDTLLLLELTGHRFQFPLSFR